MRLDQGSLIFTPQNGECPSWETALGQSHEGSGDLPPYHFKAEGYENLLKGMFFNSIPLAEVSCILGKQKTFVTASESYKSSQNQEIQLASKFDTIVVRCGNEVKTFRDIPIVLLFTKIQDANKFHFGRRSIKYSPHTSVGMSIKNSDSFERIQKHFNTRLACYGLFVEHFDTLHFYCVDADSTYDKEQWKKLRLPETEWTDWASWEVKELQNIDFQKYLEFPIVDESTFKGLDGSQIEQRLAAELKKERQIHDSIGFDYFGFKYSTILAKFNISNAKLLKLAGLGDSFQTEINKGKKIFSIAYDEGKLAYFNHVGESVQENGYEKNNNEDIKNVVAEEKEPLSPEPSFTPVQIIYYGVPGCGKSHQIQEDLKKKNITEENHQVKRVVFHPDYCNADFVGQILPVTKKDGGIRYRFKAGPFTKILRDAYANPDKEYALIIEEINRGNAAAIFGDLFQLLDRKRESDPVEVVNGNSYGPGWSDYCVENDYINAYFRGAYDSEESPDPLPPEKLGKITFNDNVDIRLPPNLSLYATMNTSDQNVFTLDNAFQRRWEMKQISNDLKNDDAHSDEKAQYDQLVGDTGVKWGVFRDKINEIIMQSAEENGLSSMEDKRLGGWFIIPKKASDAPESAMATITIEAFAEKVLKYLWDDAFKFDRKSHFGNVKTLEKLIEKFKTDDFKVFSDEQISGLSQNGSANTQTGTSES